MKKRPAGKWYLWVIIALVVKGFMFVLLTDELGAKDDDYIGVYLGNVGGDANSYLIPVENMLITGEYEPDYRMPGYAFIYYLLRLFLNLSTAQNVLVVIQSLLSAISVYTLALTAFLLFKSARMFYLVFFGFLISTYSQIFDLYLLTESLTVSVSIFALYYLVRGIQEERNGLLAMAGLWTTWVIFLRPVYAPYLLFFILIILINGIRTKEQGKKIMKSIFMLVIPFAIIDGIWIARNYQKYSQVQPLTKSVLYPDALNSYFVELLGFLQSWGGSYIFWDPSAEIRLLGVEESSFGVQMKTRSDLKFPENIYTSEFNYDSLQMIRSLVLVIQNKNTGTDSIEIVNDLLKEKLHRYTLSVKNEHPFQYHVTSRLKYFKMFLIHSGTYNLMHDPWVNLGTVRKAVKVFYSLFYLFVIFGGLAGSILLIVKYRDTLLIILPAITLYSIIIFPWILRLPEMRYFVPAYPFMLLCSMYVVNELMNRMSKKV